jgi:fumarate hydratase, class I
MTGAAPKSRVLRLGGALFYPPSMIRPLDMELLAWGQSLNGPWGPDGTPYRRLPFEGIRRAGGRLVVPPEALEGIARRAFIEINHFLPASQLEAYAGIVGDPEASEADRYAALCLLRNAAIAADGSLPLCQDTGTATILGFRGDDVTCGADEAGTLAQGAVRAYEESNFRYSQVIPISMCEEADSGDNSPAQVDLRHSPRGGYRFLFIAKGGGSANKAQLYQETKALLDPEAFEAFLRAKVPALGTAACPPYHLSVVVGGTSAEQCLQVLKLSTAGFIRFPAGTEPETSDPGLASMGIVNCPDWGEIVQRIARESGLGAQFGGKWLSIGAQVIRLPRHAASCPVALGLSCNAHRNARAYLTDEGAFMEAMDRDPGRFLVSLPPSEMEKGARRVDLDRPMPEILAELGPCRPGELLLLSGALVVARDASHARLHAGLKRGAGLPDWFKRHPVIYAGPAKAPPGASSGSFGPTTAGRMDPYVEEFMDAGASFIMIAKGNRSAAVARACAHHGGLHLGVLGGAAALIAREHIVSEEILDYPELGMEAARLVRVKGLPAFVVIDSRGADLYASKR